MAGGNLTLCGRAALGRAGLAHERRGEATSAGIGLSPSGARGTSVAEGGPWAPFCVPLAALVLPGPPWVGSCAIPDYSTSYAATTSGSTWAPRGLHVKCRRNTAPSLPAERRELPDPRPQAGHTESPERVSPGPGGVGGAGEREAWVLGAGDLRPFPGLGPVAILALVPLLLEAIWLCPFDDRPLPRLSPRKPAPSPSVTGS